MSWYDNPVATQRSLLLVCLPPIETCLTRQAKRSRGILNSCWQGSAVSLPRSVKDDWVWAITFRYYNYITPPNLLFGNYLGPKRIIKTLSNTPFSHAQLFLGTCFQGHVKRLGAMSLSLAS